LERLGTRDAIVWQPEKLITLATQPPTVLRHRRWLTPPLGLLRDLARVPELDRIAALDYLRAARVTERMIDWFWRFACMAVMNVPLEGCSTAALLRVHAQLIGRRGIHFGFPAVGLSELYVPQIERLLGERIVRNREAVRIEPGAVVL